MNNNETETEVQRPRVPDFTAENRRVLDFTARAHRTDQDTFSKVIVDTFGDRAEVGTCTVAEDDDLEYVQLTMFTGDDLVPDGALVLSPPQAIALADALLTTAVRTATIRFGNLRISELASKAETIIQPDA